MNGLFLLVKEIWPQITQIAFDLKLRIRDKKDFKDVCPQITQIYADEF